MTPSFRILLAAGLVMIGCVVRAKEQRASRVLGADNGRVAVVAADGKVEWEYANKAECHDVCLLPGGNVLMVTGRATVSEITPDKKVAWSYEAKPKEGYKGR